MPADIKEFQNKLWEAADKLRANSNLKGVLPRLISGEIDVEGLEVTGV